MKSLLVLLVISVSTIWPLSAQIKYDYRWVIGYDTSLFDPGGDAIILNFNEDPVQSFTIKTVDLFHMEGANTSISDTSGNLLFYSNGCFIVNAAHEIMLNGDSINPGIIQDGYCDNSGSPLGQAVLALPWPEKDSLFLVFNVDFNAVLFPGDTYTFAQGTHLYYHLININKDNGLGAVTQKLQVAIADTLAPSQIRACGHANGRDWWVIIPEARSNCYYLTLVTPDGVQPPVKQCEGLPWNEFDRSGQSVFSPDGMHYIRYNKDNGIFIYDFDSSTGALSNQLVVDLSGDDLTNGGVAISPNSRFLYVSGSWKLFQFDLWAADIAASKILIDTLDFTPDPFFPVIFNRMALAPNGKIYMSGGSTHQSLHVINHPDCPGLACNFVQRGLPLPSWNFNTIPNFPVYRNQPSGVNCSALAVKPELSDYSPVRIYPNPASDYITVEPAPQWSGYQLSIFDANGRTILFKNNFSIENESTIDIRTYSNGLYFMRFKTEEGQMIWEKFVVLK